MFLTIEMPKLNQIWICHSLRIDHDRIVPASVVGWSLLRALYLCSSSLSAVCMPCLRAAQPRLSVRLSLFSPGNNNDHLATAPPHWRRCRSFVPRSANRAEDARCQSVSQSEGRKTRVCVHGSAWLRTAAVAVVVRIQGRANHESTWLPNNFSQN